MRLIIYSEVVVIAKTHNPKVVQVQMEYNFICLPQNSPKGVLSMVKVHLPLHSGNQANGGSASLTSEVTVIITIPALGEDEGNGGRYVGGVRDRSGVSHTASHFLSFVKIQLHCYTNCKEGWEMRSSSMPHGEG